MGGKGGEGVFGSWHELTPWLLSGRTHERRYSVNRVISNRQAQNQSKQLKLRCTKAQVVQPYLDTPQCRLPLQHLLWASAILRFQALLGSMWLRNSLSTLALMVGIWRGRQSRHSWFITLPEAPKNVQTRSLYVPLTFYQILFVGFLKWMHL